jgi:hypothetical protein
MYSFGLGVAVATKRNGTPSVCTRAARSRRSSPAKSAIDSRKVFVPPKPRRIEASSS